jgi:integrase
VSRAGSIRRDPKTKTWTLVVDLTPPGAKKRKQAFRRGFPTKAAAQAELDSLKERVRTGTFVPPSRLTLGDYLTSWLDSRRAAGLRATTIASYRSKIDAYVLTRDVAGIPLQGVTSLDLDDLYAELLRSGRRTGKKAGTGLSARTVRYVHSIIRKALSDAVRKDLVVRNVALTATPPAASAARAPEFSVWTTEELRTFLASVAGHHHGALFHLYGLTGLRRGEGLGLRWRDVDLDAGVLRVRKSVALHDDGSVAIDEVKTPRSRRTVDLDPATVAVLKAHRKAQLEQRLLMGRGFRDRGLVFAMPDGSPWNPDSISQAFERAVARAKLPAIRLHDVRHTHATHLLAAGVNVKVVSERLGHASVAFTLDTYAHVMPGQQSDAAVAVAKLVLGSVVAS